MSLLHGYTSAESDASSWDAASRCYGTIAPIGLVIQGRLLVTPRLVLLTAECPILVREKPCAPVGEGAGPRGIDDGRKFGRSRRHTIAPSSVLTIVSPYAQDPTELVWSSACGDPTVKIEPTMIGDRVCQNAQSTINLGHNLLLPVRAR